jgi:hypothetical protein
VKFHEKNCSNSTFPYIGVIDSFRKEIFHLKIDYADESENYAVLNYNEELPSISFSKIIIDSVIVDSTPSQRIVQDRISNPHGEHAEDIWIVNRKDISYII